MKTNVNVSKSIATGLLFLVIAAIACQPSHNVVVIEDAPVASEQPDTTSAIPQGSVDDFKQLNIGLIQPITTLDPLFAQNIGTMQLVQLLYEGLVELDANGQIVPAIAKEWSISADSLTYRFTLHDDIYYHDSNIFANGRGRRLVAKDVKFVFERMAQNSVPKNAAQLFMDIAGFEPYFQEQHHLFLADNRQLKGVKGIKAPNDTTVVFSLEQPVSSFLLKLASPYAVIYPPEAVQEQGFTAVGTGPFYLSQHRQDSLYILAQFDNYYQTNVPQLDRIDVHTSSNADALLQALQQGTIQLIPTLSPSQIVTVTNTNGQLGNAFANQFRLISPGDSHRYRLFYNRGADVTKTSVVTALKRVRDVFTGPQLPQGSAQLQWVLSAESASAPVDTLSAAYSSDPFVRAFYDALGQQAEIPFEVRAIRTPVRNTALVPHPLFDFMNEADSISNSQTLAYFRINQMALVRKTVEGLAFNRHAWWIDLRSATISPTDNN